MMRRGKESKIKNMGCSLPSYVLLVFILWEVYHRSDELALFVAHDLNV
jgi:hypothetical protein